MGHLSEIKKELAFLISIKQFLTNKNFTTVADYALFNAQTKELEHRINIINDIIRKEEQHSKNKRKILLTIIPIVIVGLLILIYLKLYGVVYVATLVTLIILYIISHLRIEKTIIRSSIIFLFLSIISIALFNYLPALKSSIANVTDLIAILSLLYPLFIEITNKGNKNLSN